MTEETNSSNPPPRQHLVDQRPFIAVLCLVLAIVLVVVGIAVRFQDDQKPAPAPVPRNAISVLNSPEDQDQERGVWPKDRAFYLGEPTSDLWVKETSVPAKGVLESIRTRVPKNAEKLEEVMLAAKAKKDSIGKWDLKEAIITLTQIHDDPVWDEIVDPSFRRGVGHENRKDSVRVGDFVFLPPKRNSQDDEWTIRIISPDDYLQRAGAIIGSFQNEERKWLGIFSNQAYSKQGYNDLLQKRRSHRVKCGELIPLMKDLGVPFQQINDYKRQLNNMASGEETGDMSFEAHLKETLKRKGLR